MSFDNYHSGGKKISIVFHIDENLDEQNKQRIRYCLLQAQGIADAHFDKVRHQLLIIEYNPSHTDSSAILERIKEQQLHAQLIVGI